MTTQDWAKDLQPVHLGPRREFYHERAGLHLVFDMITPTSSGGGGLYAWCEARWIGEPHSGKLIHKGKWDLMGSTTDDRLAKAISRGCPISYADGPTNGPDWLQIVTAATYEIVAEHLQGEQPVDLAEVQHEERPKWLLRPFIQSSGASGLVADGGTGKSLLALAMGFSVAAGVQVVKSYPPQQTGPVLYLDYEDDAETHAERLQALSKGSNVPIPKDTLHYIQMNGRPLHRSATQLEKRVAELGAVLVIIDSTMLARGGDANAAEPNTMYHAAIRQLGVPALTIEHKNKSDVRSGRMGVFGSQVNVNSARLLWEFIGTEEDGGTKRFLLQQVKENQTGKVARQGLSLRITQNGDERMDTCLWEGVAASKIRVLRPEAEGSVWEALAAAISTNGPMTVHDLAAVTGKTEGSVRTTLNRYPDKFHKVPKTSPTVWAVTVPGAAAGSLVVPF